MVNDVRAINIGGTKIGIIGIDNILKKVKAMDLREDEDLEKVLLDEVNVQNYLPSSDREIYAKALLREYHKSIGIQVEEEDEYEGLAIQVLGPGCHACDTLLEDTLSILTELNVAANVERVSDAEEISSYGVLGTPALVINKNVLISGKILPRPHLKKLIKEMARGR